MINERIENFVKSEKDKTREYRGLVLNNQMKILLISDMNSENSVACLDVEVGSLNDPDQILGLAHLCEQMLPLGNAKFLNEKDFKTYLSEFGGKYYGHTGSDVTSYYFEVDSAYFKNALERFSQYFISPSFPRSYFEKKIADIDASHQNSLDFNRFYLLDKHLAKKEHPYHNFEKGNKKSLKTDPEKKGIDVHKEIINFFGKWYSSNLMTLVVSSEESLEVLEQNVVKYFSDIKNTDAKASEWTEYPFEEKCCQTITYYCPENNDRELKLIFPYSHQKQNYKFRPANYISHVFYTAHEGSLLHILKKRGWAKNITAYENEYARGFGFFEILLELTETGIENINDVVKLTFQFINLIKEVGPQTWIYEEMKHMNYLRRKYEEKSLQDVCVLAYQLQKYSLKEVLDTLDNLDGWEWNADIIQSTLCSLTAEKIRIYAPFENFYDRLDSIEPWTGTRYSVEKIAKNIIDEWTNSGASSELKMPEKNVFIPEDLSLYPVEADATNYPVIIQESSLLRVWFKQDDLFRVPEAGIFFKFYSPISYSNPANYCLSEIFRKTFQANFEESTYSGISAGFICSFARREYGFEFSVEGFNDKIHLVVEKFIKELADFKADEKWFLEFQDEIKNKLDITNGRDDPRHLVDGYLDDFFMKYVWSREEKLTAIKEVTFDVLENFVSNFFSKLHIEVLIHGNLIKSKALDLVSIVENGLKNTFSTTSLQPEEVLKNEYFQLKPGSSFGYQIENSWFSSLCIATYYQCGLKSVELSVKIDVFRQLFQNYYWDKKQNEVPGFRIYCCSKNELGVQGLIIKAYFEKHLYANQKTQFLIREMEEIITSIESYIQTLTDVKFQALLDEIAREDCRKPKASNDVSGIFWTEISENQYDFERAEKEVEYLKMLNKTDIIDFYKDYIRDDGTHSKTFTIYLTPVNGNEMEKIHKEFIRDVGNFRSLYTEI